MKFRGLGPDSEVPPSPCPYCGAVHDLASGLDNREKPDSNSVSVCLKCAGISLFTDELTLREPTARELIDLQRSIAWAQIERAVRIVRTAHARIAKRARANV